MKPKDLMCPFSWEDRHPVIGEGVFFIPDYYGHHSDFEFPGWCSQEIFLSKRPVCIEFCSGNGHWLIERALSYPHFNWIGVEKRFDRVRKIWSKMKNQKISNLFIVCGEANTFVTHYIKESSIEEIFVNFPDPWPKSRHEKHRLMRDPFIEQLARILISRGKLTFVTDDKNYLEETLYYLLHNKDLSSLHPYPYYLLEMPGYGTSFFEELWRSKKKNIHYVEFIKNDL